MNPNFMAKTFTLDWDNISLDEVFKRLRAIRSNYTNVRELVYRVSPNKSGYHILGKLWGYSNIPRLRFELGDDPRRLLHDIFNRPDNIHDVLWNRKTIEGKVYKAGKWIRYL